MFEADLITLLGPLVANKVFWDTTPDDFVVTTPVIILQQVGGKAGWYIDQTMPSHKHARIQVRVWARRRMDAAPLARLIEKTIAESAFIAEPFGAAIADNQPDMKLYGTHQAFGIWYPDP